MNWVTNFITPIVQLTFILGIILFLAWVVTRFFMRKYQKSWKWVIKYTLARQKYDQNDVKFCMDAIDKKQTVPQITKYLLLDGCDQNRLNEIVWIYKKIYKEMKGGLN